MAGHSYTNVEVMQAVKRGERDNGRIAARLGVARCTVAYWRRRYGLSNVRGAANWDARARELGFADTAAAVRVWAAAGLTNGAMADRLGCWPAQLAPYLRGVTRPPGRGRVQRGGPQL
jgi:DNA-binding CsgD family transcriptional regulator